MTRRQHFVEFFSPGTFMSESSARPIETWNVARAYEMSQEITERYASKPYAFQFFTSIVSNPIDDGEGGTLKVAAKQVEKSGLHFINGKIIRYEDVPDTQEYSILRSNMRGNDMPLVCETRNSWKSTNEFGENDCIVEGGVITIRASDLELKACRKRKIAEFKTERDADIARWEAESKAKG